MVILEVENNVKTSPDGSSVHDCCRDDDQDGDQRGWDDMTKLITNHLKANGKLNLDSQD